MSVYLGIDIGTSSAKCLAVDAQGEPLALTQQPYQVTHPREGWVEQDAEQLWNALLSVVRQCVEQIKAEGRNPADVQSLAMSTQGDTLIVTDATGKPLIPAISWMDHRPDEECQELLALADQGFWYSETGLMLTPFSSACKIKWLQKHRPDVVASNPRFCYVPDFLAARLTGEFVTDVPSASWQPLFSPRERRVSKPVVDLLGIPRESVATPVESSVVIGELLPEVARAVGLSPGTRLLAGAFDQSAAALGAGAKAGERSVLSCGTAWVLYSVTSVPARDERGQLPICCHTDSSEWGMVLPFSGGAAYDWLDRTFPGGSSEISASEPPVFIPHLYGGLCPDWREDSRGSLVGLDMSHTREDIRLALMRGIASEARRNVEAAEKLVGSVGAIRMVGGAGKSEVWPQMIANILNRPVEVSDQLESACFGAARLAAGPASGEWIGSDAIRTFAPEPDRVEFEDRQFGRYLRFYEALVEEYGADERA